MKQLGYYAKDKDGDLHQFEWVGKKFHIVKPVKEGLHKVEANADDYEILEIGFFTADSPTKQPNPYGVFLMIELGRLQGVIEKELEYDRMFEQAQGMYNEYESSEFNTEDKGEYDCIHSFLIDYHNKNIAKPLTFPKFKVEVKFTDLEGQEQTLSTETDGEEEDFWMGFDQDDKGFELNIWFDDMEENPEKPNVNVYQLTEKKDGNWTMDNMEEFAEFELTMQQI